MSMTTHGEIPGTRIWGRPFKPLAVGLITVAVVYSADAVLRIAGHEHALLTFGSPAAGVLSLIAAALMVAAWWIRSQAVYEAGLLLMMGALTARAVEVALLGNATNGALPLAMAVMAGGAYWLEKIDDGSG